MQSGPQHLEWSKKFGTAGIYITYHWLVRHTPKCSCFGKIQAVSVDETPMETPLDNLFST